MHKALMKGNEALGEAAIKAGCRYFFGYPITPQNEVPEYLAKRMPEVDGVFLQAESEVAAINMVYGASAAGARVMTSSSSPGISLKQEGISYIAAAELPCVIVNIMRGGPGLGGIQAAQSDYFQATKGGGNGDYRLIVYAPASIQELVDITMDAFDVADKYRNPVMILGDGVLGQMMEPVEFKETALKNLPIKPWACTGRKKYRPQNIVNSLYLDAEVLEQHNFDLLDKYEAISQCEKAAESYMTSDAEIVLVAYGTTARIVKAAVHLAREKGIKAGMVRPVTLWPFPDNYMRDAVTTRTKAVLTVEMSTGQLIEDVRLAVDGKVPVHFYGRVGGVVPSVKAVYHEICRITGQSSEVPDKIEKGIRYFFEGGIRING